MKSNLPQHPCGGKCTALNEQCDNCFVLTPTCGYCGSDQLVRRVEADNCFICSDCLDEPEPAASFATGDAYAQKTHISNILDRIITSMVEA